MLFVQLTVGRWKNQISWIFPAGLAFLKGRNASTWRRERDSTNPRFCNVLQVTHSNEKPQKQRRLSPFPPCLLSPLCPPSRTNSCILWTGWTGRQFLGLLSESYKSMNKQ